MDRWITLPSLLVGVALIVAAVPPGGATARGLRVEAMVRTFGDRPWLVRVTVDDRASGRWRAPAAVRFDIRAPNAPTRTHRARATPRTTFLLASLPVGAEPHTRVHVDAEGLVADVPLPPTQPRTRVVETPAPLEDPSGVTVAIEGGMLVPEIVADVVVRIRGGDGGVLAIRGADESLRVDPPTVALDACGIGRFRALARGFDAQLILRLPAEPTREIHRRLAVAPGALTARVRNDQLEVELASPGAIVYWLAGDADGATSWAAVRVPDNAPDAVQRFTLSRDDRWAWASLAPDFDPGSGAWRPSRVPTHCGERDDDARYAALVTPLPALPRVALVFDGAEIAARVRAARKHRIRLVSLAVALASILALVFRVVRVGFARVPAELAAVDESARGRAARVAAYVALTILVSLALAAAFLIHAE